MMLRSGLLLTLALTLVTACGSRSSLVERGAGLGQGTGGAAASGGSGGDPGSGGAAGSGGGGSCSDGERACDVDDVKNTLVCSGGGWQSAGVCAAGWNCDPSSGVCAVIVQECADLSAGARYCAPGDELMECGPNLVSSIAIEVCNGSCVAMGQSAVCAPASCGDGKVQAGEACDDGNPSSSDDCTELCQFPLCGDGFLGPLEDCDDGNTQGGDECPLDCTHLVLEVAAGGLFSCALHDSGQVKCWGDNGYGQLGLGDQEWRGDGPNEMGVDLPVVDFGAGRKAKLVAAGWYHACALLDDDSLECWGHGGYGQLGLGSLEYRGDEPNEMGDALPSVDVGSGRSGKALALGVGHTCALLDDDSVKCWGYGDHGETGLGSPEWQGDEPNEMGDALPTVDLGSGRFAKALAAGTYHTCALLDDDSVKCWGTNNEGQLGLGDQEWRGDGPNEMGDALPAIDLGSGRTAQSISAGHSFTCALLDDDSIKCWGTNESGQLGQGDDLSRGDGPNEMGDALPAIDLGSGRSAQVLTTAAYHACAILDDGSVKCWGYNEYGTLGVGDRFERGDDAGEMGDALLSAPLGSGPSAQALATGGHHTCVLLAGGLVKCWGANDFGQLGQGDLDGRGDDPDELGDALPAIDFW